MMPSMVPARICPLFLLLTICGLVTASRAALPWPLDLSDVTPGPAIPLYSWGVSGPDDPHQLVGRMAWRRVDGAAVMLGYRHAAADGQPPRVAAELGYSPARRHLLASVETRYEPSPRLTLVLSVWSTTRPFQGDDNIVGSTENTMAAILAGRDYRDYYDGRGWRVGVAGRRSGLALETELRVERRRSLATSVQVMPFGDEAAPPNATIPAGEARLGRISLSLGGIPPAEGTFPVMSRVAPRRGRELRLTWERAGGPLGGNAEHERVQLTGRARTTLARDHELAVRIELGTNLRGPLEPPDLFELGGPGTLRGHRLKSLSGDREILLNGEYAVPVLGPMQLMAGFDAGRAWDHRREPDGGRLEVDGVLGVQSADRRLSVLLARNLRDRGAAAIVRLQTSVAF